MTDCGLADQGDSEAAAEYWLAAAEAHERRAIEAPHNSAFHLAHAETCRQIACRTPIASDIRVEETVDG